MTDLMPEGQNVGELKRDIPEMRELVEERCVDHDGEKIKEEECERLQNVEISSNKSSHCQEFTSPLTKEKDELTKEKDEETIERSSYMALDVESSDTLGPSEEQGKAVEDGSSATTGTTDIEELWGKEQPNDGKELSTSMNAEVSNLWHDELKVINNEESVRLANKEKNVEQNATKQDTDEILNKEEKLNDELETAPQIEATEASLQEEEFKDEKSEEVINRKIDVKNPEDIKMKDKQTDKGSADASSATQLTAEEETEQIEEVPAAQDEVQCINEVLGHDELDTQLPMQDVPEVSEAGTDDNLVEDESKSGTHNDELERVHEDKDTMTTVQTKSSDGDSNYITYSLQLANPSEKKKPQALSDVNITQDNALMEVERESGLEKPLDAVYQNIEAREEIDDLEKENTCQEELTVKEKFEDDEKEYEMKDGFVHNYQDPSSQTLPANGEDDNTEEDAGDLPAAQESSEETVPEGEMQESGVTSSSQDLSHDAGDHLHQQTRESEPENFMNNSEVISEGPSSKTVAEAEVINADVLASSVKVLTTVTSPSISQATIQEDTEEAMGHKEPIEERIEVVDNNEDHDRHTFEAIIKIVIENMIHEDSTKFEDTNPEDEGNDTNTAGVSSMEQLEGEKLSEGDELEKEKVNIVSAVSHKCLGESKTEETQYRVLEKEKHEMENDPNLVFETIIKEKHSSVTRDTEDEHLEKQECIKDNYSPRDEVKETVEKDEDEDLQEVGHKHEEDLNYPHEQEILETLNNENNIVDYGGHASQTAEMVSESGPEQKSEDQMDEIETTRIDKSIFDDNFSNMNATDELREETAMPSEIITNTNENEFVEATIQEKVHEDHTESICKEKNQHMTNDVDMIQEEMESKNSEKASQFVFAEHQHNKISGSEAVCINPSAEDNSKEEAFGDLCTSQASKEENPQKENDPEATNEDIPALNNDYESRDSNAGAAEVVVEKEIRQRTEEQRCKEDETAAGMSLPQDNKIRREKTDPRSESEVSESPTLSADPEICPGETTTNKASLEVIGSEDKLGKPIDVVSEKTIVDETSISTQDVEEMDLLEKQKESFQEKAEVLMPPTIGSEDNIRNPSDAVSETIMAESSTSTQDVGGCFEKQEERFHEKAKVSMVKIVGLEDKVENPSDVISEKTVMAETIASNQGAKEMDLLGKQEESFKEKGKVIMLLEHVARTGTDNPSYEEDDASLQYIKDAEGENQEESLKDLNSTYAEQTYGTINISNKIEREPSQKLEFVSKSAHEDEDDGANRGKQAGKNKNSPDDGSLKRTIHETREPSDLNENAKDEITQHEYIGNNHDSCLLVEEIVHSAISEKHTEGQSSDYEEQTYQSANLEGIIQGDVSEDKKDTEKLEIPSESLIEIEGQKEIGESVFTEMDSLIGDESSKMMHGVAEKVKDEKNQSRALEEPQSPDSHALVLPIPSESNDEKYEESSKSVLKEQCHQTTSVGEKTKVDAHKERTDSKGLHIIEEKVEIPEIVADRDESQTVKAKDKDTLEEDISNIPNTDQLLQKTTNNGVGEDHEYHNNISNSEDTLITDIDKEKEKNVPLDTESENSEKAPWLATEEHQHNKISGLEVNIDPSTGGNSTDNVFGDLCNSQASEEENTQKATHPEETNEDIYAVNNNYESHDSNAEVAEVVIEKEIHQRTEELRCNEDEIATRMSLLHDDKIQREKIDTRSELEASESPTISVHPEIYLDETTADNVSLEVIGSEDTIGNPSDAVSEKTIVDETSTSTEDVEEMDLLEKQKESFEEKTEVIMLPTIDSADEIRNPSDDVSKTIMSETSTSAQDVEEMDFLEKREENFHEKHEVSMLQIVGSEDKVESPFEVVPEKIIMAETIASNEEAKEMNFLGKQEEIFQEKAELTMPQVAKMGSGNPSYIADGASLEFNNEAEGGKQEESPKDLYCTYAEQTYGTINIGNKIERETSQEHEFVSKSVNEDEDQGANIGNQGSKIKNSLDDGSLKRTIPETREPSDLNENAKDKTTQHEHIGNNRDSCLLVDKIVHSAISEKPTEGQSSVDEEQTHKSANLEGIIQGNVNEDKKEMEKLGIPSGSLGEIKGQEKTGESVFTEMDSSIDDDNSKMVHVVAEQVKDEENDENYKESSKSVFEEQCHQTTNLGEKIEAYVHKERTDSDSLQIVEVKVDVPEIVANCDDSGTVKMKAEDALKEDISNTPNSGELVEKATGDGVGEDQEYGNNITNSEDTIITNINKQKAKIDQLDIESDLRPEDHSQIIHGDKESVKVEETPSLENDTQSSTVKQMTKDGESGSTVEKNVKEMAYELKYDEILEHISIRKNIDDDVQKKEEPLNNFVEKSVSSESANCDEADSGRKMLDEEAKDANFVSGVYEENQNFEEVKPTNTYSDQDNERKVNDGIKSETATDEVEVSQIASAAQKSESLAEMKPDKFQLPDYGSQTLNANVQEDQTCTTRGNNNDRDILELINMDEHTKNKDENANKILDSSHASNGLTYEAHRNLDGDWDGSTIEINYSKDEIPNQEVDSELRSREQNREVRKDTNPIEVETSVNDVGEEVQKKHEKDPESSSEDQINEGHIKNIYLATLKERDRIVELENDSFSMSSEQNGNEIIGRDILHNDQMEANSSAKRIATPMEGDDHCHDGKEVSEVMGNYLQDEAKVNDANLSCSSMQSQGMGGDELNMVSVKEIETLESAKKEENTMDQEALDACPSEITLSVAAKVKHPYPQRIKIEERTLTEAKIEESNLLSQEVLERTNSSIECPIPHEEIVKTVNTGDEIAKVAVQYEASKCHMVDSLYASDELSEETTKRASGSYKQMTPTELESLEKGDEISTRNDEITETSVKLDESSRCDTKEPMQLEAPSSTMSNLEKVESDVYTETKIEAKDDAFESTTTTRVGDITANEQFQEEENESKKDKEPEAIWEPEITDSTPKDEVEICDSKLAQIGLSEKTEKTLPIDDEDLIKSLRAENAKQKIAEKFGERADYKPIGFTEQTCDANELGIELPKEKESTAEYPAEIEKLMHIAGYTASVPEIHVNDGKVPDDIPGVLSVSEPTGEERVIKKDSVNPTELSNLQSDEEDMKDSSSVEVTGSKEISHKIHAMPDPELQSPEEKGERVQLEEEASCEAVEFSNLQDEKKQQAEGNNLPVSRLLMDHILSEEKVKPDKACDVGAEDNTLHDGGEQHDAGIPKEERISVTDETNISRHCVVPDELQTTPGKFESKNKIHEKLDEGDQNGGRTEKEEILVSFSPENATGKTSISEDNVGQEKLEIGSPLVEENQVCASKEKTEIPVVKDDVKPKNSPHDSSPTMPVSEDASPSLTEMSACGVENDSREPTLTEKRNTENKMDIQGCILPASVQNEEVHETILEKYPKEQTNQKNDEVLNSDVLPLVLETSHEDNLLEEGSKEGKAILQDVRKRGKASCEVLEGQYPSNAEAVGETKSLFYNKETLPNPNYDQNENTSSNLKDDLHGQTSEIESEVKMVENEDEDADGFTGNQVPHEKKKSTGKAYLSEQQEVDQSKLADKSTDQTLEVAKNLPDKILAVHTDEQIAVGITEAQADEDNSEGENDEYKPEESGNDARVVVEARDADLKPAHKKSHNILSGVGSKFKHSLSKVKKAITGKSSHSKTSPAK